MVLESKMITSPGHNPSNTNSFNLSSSFLKESDSINFVDFGTIESPPSVESENKISEVRNQQHINKQRKENTIFRSDLIQSHPAAEVRRETIFHILLLFLFFMGLLWRWYGWLWGEEEEQLLVSVGVEREGVRGRRRLHYEMLIEQHNTSTFNTGGGQSKNLGTLGV